MGGRGSGANVPGSSSVTVNTTGRGGAVSAPPLPVVSTPAVSAPNTTPAVMAGAGVPKTIAAAIASKGPIAYPAYSFRVSDLQKMGLSLGQARQMNLMLAVGKTYPDGNAFYNDIVALASNAPLPSSNPSPPPPPPSPPTTAQVGTSGIYQDFDSSALPDRLKVKFATATVAPFYSDAIDKHVNSKVPVSVTQYGRLNQLDLRDSDLPAFAASSLASGFNDGSISFRDGQAFSKVMGLLSNATNQADVDAVLDMVKGAQTGQAPKFDFAKQSGNLPSLAGVTGRIDGSSIPGGFNAADFLNAGITPRQSQELVQRLDSGVASFESQDALGTYLTKLAGNSNISPAADLSLTGGPFADIQESFRPSISSPVGQVVSQAVKTAGGALLPVPYATKLPTSIAGVPDAIVSAVVSAHNQRVRVMTPTDMAQALSLRDPARVKSFVASLPAGPNAPKTKLAGGAVGTKLNSYLRDLKTVSTPVANPSAIKYAQDVAAGGTNETFDLFGSITPRFAGSRSLADTVKQAVQQGKLPITSDAEMRDFAGAMGEASSKGLAPQQFVNAVVRSGRIPDLSSVPLPNRTVRDAPGFVPKNAKLSDAGIVAPSSRSVGWDRFKSIVEHHLPKPGTQREGGIVAPRTNASTPDDWDAIQAHIDRHLATDPMQGAGYHNQGDGQYLAAVADYQGYDGLPEVVSAAEMDKRLKKGGVEAFRSLRSHNGVDAVALHNTLKHGPYYAGAGYYGDGTYMATADDTLDRNDALIDSRSYGGNTARIILKDGARAVEFNDLHGMQRDDAEAYQKANPGKPLPKILDDTHGTIGAYAAAKGIDAIRYNNYLNVLNRTALAIQDEQYR